MTVTNLLIQPMILGLHHSQCTVPEHSLKRRRPHGLDQHMLAEENLLDVVRSHDEDSRGAEDVGLEDGPVLRKPLPVELSARAASQKLHRLADQREAETSGW